MQNNVIKMKIVLNSESNARFYANARGENSFDVSEPPTSHWGRHQSAGRRWVSPEKAPSRRSTQHSGFASNGAWEELIFSCGSSKLHLRQKN
jgi:hypothetical protein